MTRHRPRTLVAVSCGISALLAFSPLCRQAAADEDRRLEGRLSATSAHRVLLDVPMGEVRVEGTGEQEVAVTAEIGCTSGGRRCREMVQRIDLSLEIKGGELRIGLDGWPEEATAKGLALEMRVWTPRTLDFSTNLGVGELQAAGLIADFTAQIGVGDVEVVRPESGVKRVKIDVGVGGASLNVGRREIEGSGFLGRRIDWQRDGGAAAVEVDCGVGEVAVRLE